MNRLSPQEPIQLTQSTIESLFTPPTLMRARDYVMKGRVISAKANADFRHIEGQVSGTERTPYRQDIRLFSVNHKLIMNGFCSCPATGHCKHLAAVLYSLLSDKTVEDQRIAQWLHLLDEADDPKLYEVEQLYADRVLYVLSKDDNGVFIELRCGKLTKNGGYNKGSKIALSDVQYFMPAWIGAEDVLIINLIMSTRRHGSSRLYLKAQLGAVALDKMLATERCFWEESRIALSRGEPISPTFVWNDIDNEHKQMQLVLAGKDNWELIPTEPPAYIELDYFQIGPVETDIGIDKLMLLNHMPPVPSSQIEAVSHKLIKHFSVETVPTPLAIDFVELRSPLQIRLTLTSLALPEFAMAQPFVLLEFVYQDVVLSGRHIDEALSLVNQGGKTYQVMRQLALEKEAIERLMALDFVELAPASLPSSTSLTSMWSLGPLPEAIKQWLQFIEQRIPELESWDYQVCYADNFSLNVIDTPLAIELDDSQDGWFSLSLNADIDGQSIPMLPLIATWLKQHGEPADNAELLLPSPNGTWLKVKASVIKPLVSIILELFDGHRGNSVSLPKYRAHLLNDFAESDIRLLNGQRVLELATKLENFNGVVEVAIPEALGAKLRHYQQQGLNWLCFLKEYQLGGILADDMGLGKTVQTLAFLLQQRELAAAGASPSLIICPTSLVGNWAKEAAKFAPSLKLVVIHGALRKPLLERLTEYDIVVTTYPLIVRDNEYYQSHKFEHIILDEAQQIKNAQAKVTQIIKELQSPFRLCLTGTPLENHLGELKSLMDFSLPGLLGTNAFFNKSFRHSIERYGDSEKAKILSQRIAPFVLRRTKDEVVSELPPKTEISQSLELEKDQRNLYESIRLVMEKKLRDLFATQGVGSSHIEFLDALLKLRQACCDPRLVKLEQAQKVKNNAKLDWLKQNLPEMVQEGRKILIFSQFTSMLGLIEAELMDLGLDYSKLTGQTRLRQAQIDKFQEGDTPVFLISLKAGGTGLNLTAADTVIHYDPWWNPAAEKQATDRAHRIGQEKPVFVYKLIAEGTVEEKIQEMQQHKQSLADSILEGKGKGTWQGSADELLSLFS
ncbi:DEAD/DEAH box helicase [Shewanella sp. CG12_big_fil_rev_8_21_14_0_65_47_15]|uniref:DEAD/DEAH box helicase n=1 Tax=Shewanella sp. CG12_big_fil_rev_8_21_14_0_65_47_15 TaxID=1975537 RepID=UPI000CA7373F|nr:DEAD/DEAH box helicase [Shewanella sp. CG12_big_fil_rev_8_21_14_0_65_47_15]PIW61058.1 MAG: helicase [Shewanella sp. CG12_big_fil_rev_8_21_14_0_65_47_15]